MVTAGLVTATGNITSTANVAGGNVIATTQVSAGGNVTGGNITTTGLISASGNVTGANIIGTGFVSANDQVIINSSVAAPEGAQFVMAWKGVTGLTGQANGTWNLDVDSSNVFRVFYQNAAGGTGVPLSISPVTGQLTLSGNLSTTGNISAGFFIGDGSQLTNLSVTAGSQIINGTSNVSVALNGNVTVGIAGTTRATFASTGEYITGDISASGNVTANNFIGNANASSLLSGTVPGARLSGTYNIDISGIAATANAVTNNAQPNVTSVGTLTSLSVSGNAVAANVNTGGLVSAGGNVTGGNITTGGLVTATGNITSTANIAGGNLVTAGLISAGSNVTGGNINTGGLITATGNITGGNITTAGLITATGNITSTANVAGSFILGNGYFLTGIITSVANINNGNSNVRIDTAGGNVQANVGGTNNVWILASTGQYVTGVSSVSGNITGGNITTGGLITATGNIAGGNITTAGLITATGNITATANVAGGNITTAGLISAGGNIITGGLISATGNVTANYFLGNGACLTGVITSVANINNGSSNVRIDSAGGNIQANVGGTANIFTVASTGFYVSGVTSVSGTVTGGGFSTSGTVSAGGNVTGGNITTGGLVTATGNITSTANVAGGNVIATTQVSAGGNVTGGNITTAGLVTATGNITGGNINTGGLITATGNITSTANVAGGNLVAVNGVVGTTLTVGGDATIAGNLVVSGATSNVNVTNLNIQDPVISLGRGANNTPLSSNDGKDRGEQLWYYSGTEKSAFVGYKNITGKIIAAVDVTNAAEVITVNNYGTFVVGNLEATLVSASGNVTGGNLTSSANISAAGNISASYYFGNGSQLSGIAVDGNSFKTLSVVGNVTGNATANSTLTASTTTGVLIPKAGNGIVMIGNATTNNLLISVIGSTNDGTAFAANNDFGLVTQSLTQASTDLGLITSAVVGIYDLGSVGNGDTLLAVVTNIIPIVDATLTLGNATNRWLSANISGNITSGNVLTGTITSTGNVTGGNLVTTGSVNAAVLFGEAVVANSGLIINSQTDSYSMTIPANSSVQTMGQLTIAAGTTTTLSSGSQHLVGNVNASILAGNGITVTNSPNSITITSNVTNVTITNLTTNVTLYPLLASNTSGNLATVNTANAALSFNPATGTLTTDNLVLSRPLPTIYGGTGQQTFAAGADYVAPNQATSLTATMTFAGSAQSPAMRLLNSTEIVNVVSAAPATVQFLWNNGAIQYYTANTSANFSINFTFSSSTTLNNAIQTGDSITCAILVTNGSSGFYPNAFTVDGASVTPKWQGGTAPSSGNANSVDSYVFNLIKTGISTFVVFASQTKFA